MADVTLPNMGLVQPSNGGSSGSWGTKANENFAKLDVHDHTPGLGPKVPVLGIDIDDDLSFVGEFAPIHLHHLSFDQIAATPGAGSFFVNSADHELYFRNFGSASIKITSGSELNVAAFTGGFIGDYAAAAARAFFDSGANQYKFTDVDSKRSVIQCGSIQIVEFNAIESTSVTLAVPAALATPYTIEMPGAVPAATAPVMMSHTGVLSYQSVGPLVLPASAGNTPTGSSAVLAVGSFHWTCPTAADVVVFPVALLPGVVITSVDIWYTRTSGTLTFDLRKQVFSSGSTSSVASTTSASGTSIAMATIASINHTVTSTDQYLLQFTPGGGGDTLIAVIVHWAYA